MQVSSTKINNANGTIHAVIDHAQCAKAEQRVAQKLSKEVKIDGFRKGKIPLAVLKSRLGDKLENDVRSQLAQEAFEAGIKELGEVQLIGMPAITKINGGADGLEMDIKFSLRPAFELGDYLAFVPAHKPFTLEANELESTLQKAADSTAAAEEITENRALAAKDIAVFDFDGFIDSKPLENGSGKNHELLIGSNTFIPGFEEQLIGLKKGESKTIEVTFPAKYHAEHLAGKAATFNVTLHKIKVKNPVELNDQVAAKLLPNVENADLQKLRDAVEKSLINDKKMKLYNEELRPKLLETLGKKYSFDLPELIVDQEIDHLANQKIQMLDEAELTKLSKDEKSVKELRESVRDEAVDRVRTTLVIDSLAKAENIAITDQEVLQVIYYEALQTGQDPKATIDYYRKNNLLAVVRMSLTEDRVLNTLLDKKNSGADAKIDEKSDAKSDEKPEAKTAAKKPAKKSAKASEKETK